SDAISWVLGEQSAKTLRGARMEDVIFAGTRDRKPLGMAQVTLTMTDPAAKVAATQAEKSESGPAVLNGIHGTNGGTNGLANGHHANGHASPDNVKPATGHASGLGHHAHGHTGEVTITRRLTYRMRDHGIRYGLQTMCEGGGQANATILELLQS
ncbi:MAG: hypothetical protein ACLPQY_30860, partial [Streptosporangiaceae bacterium]